MPVHEAHDRIGEQVLRVALARPALGVDEEPADVGVEESLQRAAEAAPVPHVWTVRVALLVREGVVLPVVGHPRDDRPLDRRRAQHGEGGAHRLLRLEAAMREVAVEADRDAQPRGHVHDREHDHVAPAQEVTPDLPHDQAKRQHGHRRDDPRGNPVCRLVQDGLDIVPRPYHLRAHVSNLPRRAAFVTCAMRRSARREPSTRLGRVRRSARREPSTRLGRVRRVRFPHCFGPGGTARLGAPCLAPTRCIVS